MDRDNPAERTEVPAAPPENERLDSWKEIAAYLRRDESTVRRWEKDGLPVHRHHHKLRASIFAYKSELDVWWKNGEERRLREQAEASAHPEAAAEVMASPAATSSRARPRPWAVAAFVLALVAVGSAGGYWVWRNRAPVAPAPKSAMLAVLPLTNLSGNPDEEYFSDGLTEEMITQLSRVQPEQLNVIARTSTMQYKGTRKSVDVIGRELNANYVLEGSVRRDAGQVRISVQLIRTSDQTHLWAENYQRDLRDILALQSQVATAVAREISLKLTAQQQQDLANAPVVNPQAHELYLRGRYLWNKRTEAELQKSIAYFQQAIAQDPTHAASYAALADAYNVSGNWGLRPPREAYPQAKAAASQALAADPRSAEARVALAYATFLYDWNAPQAEQDFKQALTLNPNYAAGHQWYAVYLASAGRFDDAIRHVRTAQRLDPLSLIIGDVVGWIHALARRYDQAVAEFQKAIELDPNFYPTHFDLGMTYAEMGKHREAIEELEKARTLSGDTARTLSGLAYAYAVAGQPAKAKQLLGDLRKLSRRRYVPPFDLAVVYAALGEKDEAFVWLEKALADRHPWLVMLRVTGKVDSLRPDARFTRLLQRIAPPPQS